MATLADILTSRLPSTPTNSLLMARSEANRNAQTVYTKEALVKVLGILSYKTPATNKTKNG